MSSDYHYGWRDIGMGPRRKEPLIKGVYGNFDFNNQVDERYVQPKGCPFCSIVLTWFDKIQKHICTKCGHPMTEQDRRILEGREDPTPTIDKQKVLPNNDIEIDESGFTPMKRAGNTDVLTRREQADGIGSGYVKTLPSRRDKKSGLYETPSGKLIPLDPDREKMLNQGYILTDGEDIVHESSSNTWETITPSELRMRENPKHRDRFRSYDEPSGLSVNGRSGYKDE
jgi:hypothetical protein